MNENDKVKACHQCTGVKPIAQYDPRRIICKTCVSANLKADRARAKENDLQTLLIDPNASRRCRSCGTDKRLAEYRLGDPKCRECHKKTQKTYIDAHKDARNAKRRAARAASNPLTALRQKSRELAKAAAARGQKYCLGCGKTKDIDDFSRKGKNGRQAKCKVCVNKIRRTWYLKNREKVIRNEREYQRRKANKWRTEMDEAINRNLFQVVPDAPIYESVGKTQGELRNEILTRTSDIPPP